MRAGRRYVLGIDEAGRGPIVGPMVVAGVLLDEDTVSELVVSGVRDSKELSPARRRRLAEEILGKAFAVIIVKVPPSLIDSVNLNRLEEDTFRFIAGRAHILSRGALASVYADAVGNPERLADMLRATLPANVKVKVAPKADQLYPPVSAASIVAKVVRDSEIEKLRRLHGLRGSGYPTDPETLEWIREAYARSPDNPPSFIRRSWGTLKTLAPRWYKRKQASRGKRRPNSSGRQGRRVTLLDYLKGRQGGDNGGG